MTPFGVSAVLLEARSGSGAAWRSLVALGCVAVAVLDLVCVLVFAQDFRRLRVTIREVLSRLPSVLFAGRRRGQFHPKRVKLRAIRSGNMNLPWRGGADERRT
jgi:hypothetical protein